MIEARDIAQAAGDALVEAATHLRPDARAALQDALTHESNPRARSVIETLLENADIAARELVPLCQDTGTTWVRVELAEGEELHGDLQAALDEELGRRSIEAGLRASIVHDAFFDRRNTMSNTPVFLEIIQSDSAQSRVSVMLKGAGSDNASRLVMLDPDTTADALEKLVLEQVHEKATLACPPLVIGIGLGGTFDTVAHLSKHALFREIGRPAASLQVSALEERLLAAVNATGIGPAGLGGATTALAVHIESAPSHIAAMPYAINLSCCALRSAYRSLSSSSAHSRA